MATAIRLKRVGAKKEASYRIIVTDTREGSSGAAIERLGVYNPRTEPSLVRVDMVRTLYWLNEGAQPSDTVRSLLKKTGVWQKFVEGVDPDTLEGTIVEIGPPEGQRGTSHRPPPIDRAPKQYDEPAPEVEMDPEPEVTESTPSEAASEAVVEDKPPEPEVTESTPSEAASEAVVEDKPPDVEGEEVPEVKDEGTDEEEAEEAPDAGAEDAPAEAQDKS